MTLLPYMQFIQRQMKPIPLEANKTHTYCQAERRICSGELQLLRSTGAYPMKSTALFRTLAALCFCISTLLVPTHTTEAAPALLSPVNGSPYSASGQVFQWQSDGTEISAYALTIGSTEGADDVHDSGVLSADTLSHTVNALGSSATLYIRFWFRSIDGLWDFSTSTLVNSAAVLLPSIFTPELNSTFSGPSANLQWRDNGTSVVRYWLFVGSSPGARDFLSQSVNLATSYTLNNLPTDGSQIWVRLWHYNSGWKFNDHQYTASSDSGTQIKNTPEMTSPTENALLTRSEVTFQWQNNNFVPNNYWIYIGTTLGSSNIHSSGALQTANEYVYSSLPMGEEALYVRLWYRSNNSWQYTDYQYSSKLYGEAQLVWPTPGTTLKESNQVFEWSANGQSFDGYQLLLGSSQGSNNFYDSGVLGDSILTVDADNLGQTVETLHATLRYNVSGTWKEEHYRYKRPFSGGFDEPFDADISRWTESQGIWYNADLQRLSTSVGNDYALASYTDAVFSDLDFSARVRRSDNDDQPTFLSIRDSGVRTETDCWCANDGCYTFEISPAQNFAVWSCQGIDWIQLNAIGRSELINAGTAWNEMRVVAEGEELSFYINGSLAWQGNDDTHVSGSVGIGLVNFTDEKANTLDVEWARLSVPGASSNLALTGTASQSSTGFGGIASRANDGNTDGAHNNRSVSHSGARYQPWWQVDLGKQSVLENIRLHNRTDCCTTRLSNVNLFVSDTDMSNRTFAELQADGNINHHFLAGALDTVTEQALANIQGRFVRVQLSGTNYLSLAEVEVIGH